MGKEGGSQESGGQKVKRLAGLLLIAALAASAQTEQWETGGLLNGRGWSTMSASDKLYINRPEQPDDPLSARLVLGR